MLAAGFIVDGVRNFRIYFAERTGHRYGYCGIFHRDSRLFYSEQARPKAANQFAGADFRNP